MKKYAVTLVALAFAGLALGSGGLAAADPAAAGEARTCRTRRRSWR